MASDSSLPVTINLVGMTGSTIPLMVEADLPMEAIRMRVLETMNIADKASVSLMVGCQCLESCQSLLDHHKKGDVITVSLFKDVDDLTMEEIRQELSMSDEEFRGHCSILAKMKGGQPQNLAEYLLQNQLLLTPGQAQHLFHCLFPLLRSRHGSNYSLRSQLVMTVHYFCLDPFSLWEDDDCHNCLWLSMFWDDLHIDASGMAYRGICRTKENQVCTRDDEAKLGRIVCFGEELDRGPCDDLDYACEGGCGFYARRDGYCSQCSPSRSYLAVQQDAADAHALKWEDPSRLRNVARARRSGNTRALDQMLPPRIVGCSSILDV